MHIPVMLKEVITSLNIKENGIYVDLTLGRAGHSEEILKLIPKGQLICFDKDKIAIEESDSHLCRINNNYKLIHNDFKFLKNELDKLGISKVDGIFADLGVSSPQIDDPERGFSYSKNGFLDMRMNQNQTLNAWDIVNKWEVNKLITIFKNYADVKLPNRIANAIFKNRPINTTFELVDIIKKALPANIIKLKNPAKTVFQAIRVAVNNEFESIEIMLNDAVNLLKKDGILAVITFNSLEDKIVKNKFGSLIKSNIDPKLPIQEIKNFKVKTINPSKEEIQFNKRSRSAKLRILKKIN